MSPLPQQIYPSPHHLSHLSAGRPIHQSLKCWGALQNSAVSAVNKKGTQQDCRGGDGGRERTVGKGKAGEIMQREMRDGTSDVRETRKVDEWD